MAPLSRGAAATPEPAVELPGPSSSTNFCQKASAGRHLSARAFETAPRAKLISLEAMVTQRATLPLQALPARSSAGSRRSRAVPARAAAHGGSPDLQRRSLISLATVTLLAGSAGAGVGQDTLASLAQPYAPARAGRASAQDNVYAFNVTQYGKVSARP